MILMIDKKFEFPMQNHSHKKIKKTYLQSIVSRSKQKQTKNAEFSYIPVPTPV